MGTATTGGWTLPCLIVCILLSSWPDGGYCYRHEDAFYGRTWSVNEDGMKLEIQETSKPVIERVTPEEWLEQFHHGPRWHHVEEHHLTPISDQWDEEERQQLQNRSSASALMESSEGRQAVKHITPWIPDFIKRTSYLCTEFSFSLPIPGLFIPVSFGLQLKGTRNKMMMSGCFSWDLTITTTLCIGWSWLLRICGSIAIKLEVEEKTLESQQESLHFDAPKTYDIFKCHTESSWTLLRNGLLAAAKAWWRHVIWDEQGVELAEQDKAAEARAKKSEMLKDYQTLLTFGTTKVGDVHADLPKLIESQNVRYISSTRWFSQALGAYETATAGLLLNDKQDSNMRSLYVSSDGRSAHRYLTAVENAGADIENAGVLKFHLVNKRSAYPWLPEDPAPKPPVYLNLPRFKFNLALSVGNFFIRMVAEIQALFNLFWAGYPEWDGDCGTIPTLFEAKELDRLRKLYHWSDEAKPKGKNAQSRYKFLDTTMKSIDQDCPSACLNKDETKQANLCEADKKKPKPLCAQCHACQDPMYPLLWCNLAEQYFTQDSSSSAYNKMKALDTAIDEYITFRNVFQKIPNEGKANQVRQFMVASVCRGQLQQPKGDIVPVPEIYIEANDTGEFNNVPSNFGNEKRFTGTPVGSTEAFVVPPEPVDNCEGAIEARTIGTEKICMADVPTELLEIKGIDSAVFGNQMFAAEKAKWLNKAGTETPFVNAENKQGTDFSGTARTTRLANYADALTKISPTSLTTKVNLNFEILDQMVESAASKGWKLLRLVDCNSATCSKDKTACTKIICSTCEQCAGDLEDYDELIKKAFPQAQKEIKMLKQEAARIPDGLSLFREARLNLKETMATLKDHMSVLATATKDVSSIKNSSAVKIKTVAENLKKWAVADDEVTTDLQNYRELVAQVIERATNLLKWLPGIPKAPAGYSYSDVTTSTENKQLLTLAENERKVVNDRITYAGHLLELFGLGCEYITAANQGISMHVRQSLVATADALKSKREEALQEITNNLALGSRADGEASYVGMQFTRACRMPTKISDWSGSYPQSSRRAECEQAVLSQAFTAIFPNFVVKALHTRAEMAEYLDKLSSELSRNSFEGRLHLVDDKTPCKSLKSKPDVEVPSISHWWADPKVPVLTQNDCARLKDTAAVIKDQASKQNYILEGTLHLIDDNTPCKDLKKSFNAETFSILAWWKKPQVPTALSQENCAKLKDWAPVIKDQASKKIYMVEGTLYLVDDKTPCKDLQPNPDAEVPQISLWWFKPKVTDLTQENCAKLKDTAAVIKDQASKQIYILEADPKDPVAVMMEKLNDFRKGIFTDTGVLMTDLRQALGKPDKEPASTESLWSRLTDVRVRTYEELAETLRNQSVAETNRDLMKAALKRKATTVTKPPQMLTETGSTCACRPIWSKWDGFTLYRFHGCSSTMGHTWEATSWANGKPKKVAKPAYVCSGEPLRNSKSSTKTCSEKDIVVCDPNVAFLSPTSFPIFMMVGSTRTPVQLPLYTVSATVSLSVSVPTPLKQGEETGFCAATSNIFVVSAAFKMNSDSWTPWKADLKACASGNFGTGNWAFSIGVCGYTEYAADLQSKDEAVGVEALIKWNAGTLQCMKDFVQNWEPLVKLCSDATTSDCYDKEKNVINGLNTDTFFANLVPITSGTIEQSIFGTTSLTEAGGSFAKTVIKIGGILAYALKYTFEDTVVGGIANFAVDVGKPVVQGVAAVLDKFGLKGVINISPPPSYLVLEPSLKIWRPSKAGTVYEIPKTACKYCGGIDFCHKSYPYFLNKPSVEVGYVIGYKLGEGEMVGTKDCEQSWAKANRVIRDISTKKIYILEKKDILEADIVHEIPKTSCELCVGFNFCDESLYVDREIDNVETTYKLGSVLGKAADCQTEWAKAVYPKVARSSDGRIYLFEAKSWKASGAVDLSYSMSSPFSSTWDVSAFGTGIKVAYGSSVSIDLKKLTEAAAKDTVRLAVSAKKKIQTAVTNAKIAMAGKP